MQTNIFYKVKEFIKNLFSKKEENDEEVWQDLSKEVKLPKKKEEPEELVAGGFTAAPKQYTYKKRSTKE